MHFKLDLTCLPHCGGTEETQLLNGMDYSWDELYSRRLGWDWHCLLSQGEWGCCESWGGSGVSESSVLNQTNTVEFLLLLVWRVEWRGCIAELPVSRNDARSKCEYPLWHNSILRLSRVPYFTKRRRHVKTIENDLLHWIRALTLNLMSVTCLPLCCIIQ